MRAQTTANASLFRTAQDAQQGMHWQFGEYTRRDAACRISTTTTQWQGRDVACDISAGDPLIINNLQLIINTAAQYHSDACVAATFGESFVSQRLAGAPARYTFSACRGMRRLDPKDTETGYSYFGARYYESGLSIWLSVDPLSDKYPSLSSYVYCANNPVILVDPDGRSIEVEENTNGTYTVTGGVQNSDKNIYIIKDGERTGEVLGQTLTDHSFFNEENEIVKGAVIDPTDNSGKEFIHNTKNAGLVDYIINARSGEKYDFKTRGGKTDDKHVNRGMPLNGVSAKTPIYGSARDVGNYVAGMVSAKNGLTWKAARAGFDGYQSMQSGRLTREAPVSRSAQWKGFYSHGGLWNTIPIVRNNRFKFQTARSLINSFF